MSNTLNCFRNFLQWITHLMLLHSWPSSIFLSAIDCTSKRAVVSHRAYNTMLFTAAPGLQLVHSKQLTDEFHIAINAYLFTYPEKHWFLFSLLTASDLPFALLATKEKSLFAVDYHFLSESVFLVVASTIFRNSIRTKVMTQQNMNSMDSKH